jgi:hypothetical protein
MTATTTPRAKAAKASAKPGPKRTAAKPNATLEQRAACLCGCGGFPSKPTSRFLPGHDARHYAALKRAAKEQAEAKAKGEAA